MTPSSLVRHPSSATISVVIPEAILPWALDYASALVLCLQELGQEVALVKAAAPRGLGQPDVVWVVPPHGFVEMGTQDHFERVPGVIYAAWNLEQTPQSDRDLNDDTLHRWRQTMECLEDYDFTFLDCPAKAEYFRRKGWTHVYSMGLGYHPYFTRPDVGNWETGKLGNWETGKLGNWETGKLGLISQIPDFQTFDVCFYGAGKPRRVAILEALLRAGVTLHPCYGQLTFGEALFRAIAQSRIVLNIHHNEMNAFEKPRIIQEALANGAFVLTETIDHLEGFQPGVHFGMAAYHELVDAVRYYLAHDEERQQIARQGFEYVSTQVLLKTEVERAMEVMFGPSG